MRTLKNEQLALWKVKEDFTKGGILAELFDQNGSEYSRRQTGKGPKRLSIHYIQTTRAIYVEEGQSFLEVVRDFEKFKINK